MSRKPRRRKCRCCMKLFVPDYRNTTRQGFCSEPACRLASKAASQRGWLRKTGNREYFRGQNHVERVREWRKAHPGYWRKQVPHSGEAQVIDEQPINPEQISCNASGNLRALQDFCLTQDPAFVGLISMFTGSTLQDDIAATNQRLILRGRNILGLKLSETNRTSTPPCHDSQTSDSPGPASPSPAQLQLD